MSFHTPSRRHVKWESALAIILCLVIAFAFVPELSQSNNFQPASVSISATSYSVDYAILPTPLRFGENLHGVKASKNEGFNQRVSPQLIALPAYKSYVPHLNSFVNSVGDFYNVCITDLQQAYQLLDLPPPIIFS